ncbi:hypothetical protein C6499_04930 [Candidatus Poribacteria bacterium]|nr:MAG: hypothetical protein C6499_04930 [Candidatus Poribacteria bacterium]
MKHYKIPRETSAILGISIDRLRRLAENGTISTIGTPGGQKHYDVQGYLDEQTGTDITTIGYCRVSGKGQAEDLASQVAYLQKHYPEAEIIKDFGSGINFKRKGLRTLLERLLRGDKLRVVVAHRDRLARFGGEAKDTPKNFKGLVPIVFDQLPEWHVETPRQIKAGAVIDACQAIKNAKVKCKETDKFQKVSFRSRKNPRQTLYLRADSLKKNGFYVRLLGQMKMSEPLPAKPQGTGKVSERDTNAEVKDSQLIMENGRYFLCVSYVEKKKTREPSGRIVALDPGVRDFMTFFSEDRFGWLGQQCINRIQRLCQHCDNLLSRATQEQRPLRRALRKAANRIKVKIRNLIDELHKKIAHFLVTNFDIILLPTFETKQMTKRGARKLRKKSVRQMLTLSHYRFKVFLKHKAKEYGAQVIDVCEAYTSKTVSWTGELITNLGGSRVIKSSEGHRMDRDLNGARGIFIKNVARALTVRPCTANLGASKSLIPSAT